MSDEAPRPLSALPSRRARALAFLAVLVGGLAGALIGWAFVDVQCSGSCSSGTGIGALAGAIVGAAGTAVVAVLGLRAVGEWKELGDQRRTDTGPAGKE